jgi:uncharacterized heparinase superfamily protein
MMRVSVAERARLSVLIGRRAFRSLLGRIKAHPLLRWRFASTKTDRLVIAPQDLRTLPMHLPDSDPRWGGLDGFYAARLTRKSA